MIRPILLALAAGALVAACADQPVAPAASVAPPLPVVAPVAPVPVAAPPITVADPPTTTTTTPRTTTSTRAPRTTRTTPSTRTTEADPGNDGYSPAGIGPCGDDGSGCEDVELGPWGSEYASSGESQYRWGCVEGNFPEGAC